MRKLSGPFVTMLVLAVFVVGCNGQAQGPAPVKPEPVAQQPAAVTPPPTAPPAMPQTMPAAPPRQPVPLEDLAAPKPRQAPATTYLVKRGDTLWSIAKSQLGSGTRWKEIVAANPGLDPSQLTPGRQIVIPAR